jgi:heat shock protein HslJ
MGMRIGCLLVLATLAAGCGESPTEPSDLIGVSWRLVAIEPASGASTVVSNPERYTISFVDESGVSVRADCNTCSGTYALSGDTLAVGPLACTRVFCGPESLDTPYMQALASPLTATRDQTQLILRGPRATLRFRVQ